MDSDQSLNEILEENHYYPFGMRMEGMYMGSGTVDLDFDYNGKEYNEELGLNLYDYGARLYDPVIGRFAGVDPLADQFPGWSPYNYTMNNPINLIDPDGRSSESIHKDVDGNVIAEIDDGDNNVYVHNDLGGNGQHIDGQISVLMQKRENFGTGGGGEVDKVASVMNKISKFFEEGDQQQHSGENWFIYGKGSKNGWSIKAPKPDPDGANKSIGISDMLTPGRFSKENLPAGVGGFIENVSNAADRMSGQNNLPMNDTIYKCSDCSRFYRDSSGVMIPAKPNSNKPQGSIRYTRHN